MKRRDPEWMSPVSVMVLYTNNATRGTYPSISAHAKAAIAAANQSYINSGINHRLELVGAFLVDYDESPQGMADDLHRFYLILTYEDQMVSTKIIK